MNNITLLYPTYDTVLGGGGAAGIFELRFREIFQKSERFGKFLDIIIVQPIPEIFNRNIFCFHVI